MKFGLSFFPNTPKLLFPLAIRADEVGFELIFLGEHVVIPANVDSRHPYAPELGPPLPSTPLHEPLIMLGYLAALTKNIRLGTGVYLIALRHPIMAARMIATLDQISGGRVIIAAGVGWLKEEFDVLDVPWEHRGPRMDECIEVMRRLWTEETVSHQGRFYQFDAVGFAPKPVNGTVPILIGGEAPPALRRAARIGDGWMGVYASPDGARARIAELKAMRDGDVPLEITLSSETVPTLDEARAYRDAGVDRLTFTARLLSGNERTVEAILGGADRFAEEVIHKLD